MDSFGLRFIPEIVCPTRQSPIDSAPAVAGAVLFISKLTRSQLLRSVLQRRRATARDQQSMGQQLLRFRRWRQIYVPAIHCGKPLPSFVDKCHSVSALDRISARVFWSCHPVAGHHDCGLIQCQGIFAGGRNVKGLHPLGIVFLDGIPTDQYPR